MQMIIDKYRDNRNIIGKKLIFESKHKLNVLKYTVGS